MKTFLKILLMTSFVFFVWLLLFYVSLAYVNLEINPLHWSKDVRIFFIEYGALFGLSMVMGILILIGLFISIQKSIEQIELYTKYIQDEKTNP